MITRIRIEGFKSLQKVDLKLGNLNLFVGTNASGKSNFFDALRILQGIGYGFTIEEILNGKPKSANSDVWERIRGGSEKASFINHSTGKASEVITLEVSVRVSDKPKGPEFNYLIDFSPHSGSVRRERLLEDGYYIFDSTEIDNWPSSPFFEVRYYKGERGRQPHLAFEKSKPVIYQFLKHPMCRKDDRGSIEALLHALSNMQRIDPTPAILHEYSIAQRVTRMGEHGENFAAVVNAMASDGSARSAYVSWLKQLTPTEVEDVEILKGAVGEPLFAIRGNGQVYAAQILSDGTLRFAAITAAFFQPDMPDVLTIEEVENGIHPSRLRLLVELFKSRAKGNLQVMATTHSPIVLAWLKPDDYATTFFCKRDPETGASSISPLSEVPRFQEIVRKQPISDLFAEGWLEGAL